MGICSFDIFLIPTHFLFGYLNLAYFGYTRRKKCKIPGIGSCDNFSLGYFALRHTLYTHQNRKDLKSRRIAGFCHPRDSFHSSRADGRSARRHDSILFPSPRLVATPLGLMGGRRMALCASTAPLDSSPSQKRL